MIHLTIGQFLNDLVSPTSPVFYFFIAFVICVALVSCVAMKGCQFRIFRILPIILGSMFSLKTKSKSTEKKISTLKTVSVSLASRAGTGNIVGVGIAILLAGPGALFWMVLFAYLTMSTSFAECMNAQVFKKNSVEDKSIYIGGPMYMAKYFTNKVWKYFAILIGIVTFITKGFFVTGTTTGIIAQATSQVIIKRDQYHLGDWQIWVIAIIVCFIMSVVIFRGVKVIINLISKMGLTFLVIYFIIGLIVVFSHLSLVGPFFQSIFLGAFRAKHLITSLTGGIAGSFFVVLNYGCLSRNL